MNALIVYAHPEPRSFTAAMKEVARQTLNGLGLQVTVSDLYAEAFNPVAGRHDFLTVADPDRFHYQQEQLNASQAEGFSPEIKREQSRVAKADLMVFVYPLWWGGMPAILKGWFERVMSYGFAYVEGKRFESGCFQGRQAVMGLSTGGTPERFSPEGVYGPVDQLLYPCRRTMLEYLGLRVAPTFVAYASPRLTPEAREDYLAQWGAHLAGIVANKAAATTRPPQRSPALDASSAGPSPWASLN